jgi:NAD+-dependent secondary alcohol dehydrogenase Adh1
MRAVRLQNFGDYPAVTETPEPVLADDHDVLVRVEGAGVCRTDLHSYQGLLRDVFPAPLPFTLGHEVAGAVEATGPAVRTVRPGDKVILHPLLTCGLCPACRRGDDMHCPGGQFMGLLVDGGMAELVRTSERAVVVLRPDTDIVAIAPLADAGLTAYHAIRRMVPRLTAESTAVVLGLGGLGHLAVQMLRAMSDCAVVGVDPLESARQLAREVGADHVAGADATDLVASVTGGRGADVVFDFVGEGDAPAHALDLLAAKGTYSVIGYGGQVTVPTMDMVLKELRLEGNLVGTYQDLRELVTLYERGLLTSQVTRYRLDDAKQAFTDLEHGAVRGRAVLVPS